MRTLTCSFGYLLVAKALARTPCYNARMISVEEALERILARVGTLGEEQVPLTRALGRVLAHAVSSTLDLPPWPNSSMDGYALRSADATGASTKSPARLEIAGRIAAGHVADKPLTAGQAFRIFTGGPLPDGADSVIPQEEVTTEGTTLQLDWTVEGWRHPVRATVVPLPFLDLPRKRA